MYCAPVATKSTERGADVRFPPPLIYVIWTLLGVLCRYAIAAAPMPVPRLASAIGGIVILLAGLGLAASSRRLHKRTGQNPAPWKPTPELIFDGPYRFTRNPMYLGVTILQAGLGIALNNLWIVAFAAAALATVHVVAVRPEERYLSEKFGEPYREYLRKVRRYL